MNIRLLKAAFLILVILIICPVLTFGEELKPVKLMEPQMDIGRPLMQVLKDRKTSRIYSSEKLPDQELSNLLWAAFGVNRQGTGKRTAPSAKNWKEIDIYVSTADGLYLYDAITHALNPILKDDIRSLTGTQSFVKKVPVNLIFVADFSKIPIPEEEAKVFISAADTGFISQNVYLYCASEGLATVVRGSVDRPALAKAMKLRPEQRIVLSQSVGYPKKKK
ncbi:MAG: SagB/ThcOx family dehydrogenase [Desulfobacterales bacterium]|nr:SagB/ThcOx family dehydrogenase [Desulfobacteraceae bacterium]MBT7085102.1 SagB/ThcOx family dehydrogenase [Desulfobacterales bacterium]MBT7697743.1 SagB/ThcOx family dehydrogenase [Desulfobacterales bacterium]